MLFFAYLRPYNIDTALYFLCQFRSVFVSHRLLTVFPKGKDLKSKINYTDQLHTNIASFRCFIEVSLEVK